MNAIKFATGSDNLPDRIIVAWEHTVANDRWGPQTHVRFYDADRNVTGELTFYMYFTDRFVMESYNAGRFVDVSREEGVAEQRDQAIAQTQHDRICVKTVYAANAIELKNALNAVDDEQLESVIINSAGGLFMLKFYS